MSQTLPVLFVPHGAPTMALRPGPAGQALAAIAARLPRPQAIVAVTAHWDTDIPTVGGAPRLETIHDYWGFPKELYEIRYPAAGSPALAEEIRRRLADRGFPAHLDREHGLDHGAWIPLRILYPEADVPVIPVSIQEHEGPEYHLRLGEALAGLAAEGVLVVASGNLTHNLRDFQMALMQGTGTPDYVARFADWMWEKVAAGDLSALADYRQRAPEAVRAHPREDHLLPLFVALGAAGPGYRAERFHSGIDSHVLAMDAYALHSAS